MVRKMIHGTEKSAEKSAETSNRILFFSILTQFLFILLLPGGVLSTLCRLIEQVSVTVFACLPLSVFVCLRDLHCPGQHLQTGGAFWLTQHWRRDVTADVTPFTLGGHSVYLLSVEQYAATSIAASLSMCI